MKTISTTSTTPVTNLSRKAQREAAKAAKAQTELQAKQEQDLKEKLQESVAKIEADNAAQAAIATSPDAAATVVTGPTTVKPQAVRYAKDVPTDDNTPIAYSQANPKKGASAVRYEAYKAAKTIAEFYKLGGSRGDLRWDAARSFVTFGTPASATVAA